MDELRGDGSGVSVGVNSVPIRGKKTFIVLSIIVGAVLLIVAGFAIFKFIGKTSGGLIELISNPELDIERAYLEDGNLNVQVQRNSKKDNFTGVEFNISDGENIKTIRSEIVLENKEERSFIFSLKGLGLENVELVSVAPIYKIVEEEKEDSVPVEVVSEITDTKKVSSGGGGGGGSSGGGAAPVVVINGGGDDVVANCTDNIMNQDETGIDCGGESCSACSVVANCTDSIMNQNETGIDCGGECSVCVVGNCSDNIMNQDEIGIDCGGECNSCVVGPAYYVSSSEGNDSWSGKASSWNGTDGPWQTISKINSEAFLPGDSILFKRGDVWVVRDSILRIDSSGTAGNPITYSVYSNGVKPIITARQSVSGWDDADSWTEEGSNIWSMTFPGGDLSWNISWMWSQNNRGRIWFNGDEVQKAESITTPTASLPWTHNVYMFYVYSVGNPSMVFSDIEWAGQFTEVVITSGNYITLQNIDFRGSTNLIQMSGDNLIIEDCNIGLYTGQSGLIITNSDNVVIRRNVFDTGDRFVDAFEMNNAEDGLIVGNGNSNFDIYNNTFRDWGHTSYNLGVTDVSYPSTNIKFHHNFLTSPDIDFGRGFNYNIGIPIGLATGNEIYNNYFYDHPSVNQISGDGLKLYNNIFDKTRSTSYQEIGTGLGMGTYTGGGAGTVNNEIYNNIIMNSAGYGLRISYSLGLSEHNLFRNNIIFNNALTEGSGYQFRYEYSPEYILENTFENNLFYKSGDADVIYYEKVANPGDNDMTVVEFNAVNGREDLLHPGEDSDIIFNNIQANPMFVDAANGDYHLQAGSPAIDAGVDVGLTEDYEGNPIVGLPDIGPYEYQG